MKREERIAKLTQLRAEAEEHIRVYNEEMQNGNLDKATEADKLAEEKINEYTAIAQDICFEDCKQSDNPMLTAVTKLVYDTIAVKDDKMGEEKVPVRSIVDKEKAIDLLKLHKYCGSIGADDKWSHIMQKMNFLLTAQKCVDLGLNPKAVNDSYAMSEIASQFDMGKNPTSKTNLLKTLQVVVTAMLGETYKATSHDVNYLLSIYARKKNSKALTVTCANQRYFCKYIAEICHRIVTGKSYAVEYKTK